MGGFHGPRVGLALLSLAFLAAQEAAADDLAAVGALGGEPRVRVLLRESESSIRVGSTVVAPAGTGLRANGAPTGPVWRTGHAGDQTFRAAGMRVRGELVVRRVAGGLVLVNRVPLEAYVAATLGREVYPHWNPETLKAQAVVARTYALHEAARRRWEAWDLRAGARSQVYGGADAESPPVVAAAKATRGEYLVHDDEPILAVYHSASGGQTASSAEVWGQAVPYLVSLPVPDEEDSPDTYWRASISRTKLGRALLGGRSGSLREIEVIERSTSGRVLRVRVRGEKGAREVTGRDVRDALGGSVIRSTLFEIRESGSDVVFVGSGHGHGVGMSQWGAQAMAQRGASYREILAAFYPGTALVPR